MMRKWSFGLLCVIVLVRHTQGYSSGAPGNTMSVICTTMVPQHGPSPLSSAPPYQITVSGTSVVAGGSAIYNVTIFATTATPFRGFLLTTQYTNSCVDQTLRHGTFTSLSAAAQLTCNGSAVTHTSKSDKTTLTFQWTPPSASYGNIRFRATFVQTIQVFWVDVISEEVQMTPTLSADCNVSAESSTTPAVNKEGKITKDTECGSTKGCYSDCSDNGCSYFLSWAKGTSDDNIAIKMSAHVTSASYYIAFGLSQDDNMGGDSVTYCVDDNSSRNKVNNGYNVDNVKFTETLPNPTDGLGNVEVDLTDGVLTCTFTRVKAADSSGKRFALDETYIIFFAIGPGAAAGISKHGEIPEISSQAVSLVDFSVDIGGSSGFPLVKAHGSLMMVAWVLAASIGIVLARYYKNVWEGSTLFGQKIWFQVHRACMILVLLCTAIAFIIIFVDVGGYSEISGETYKKSHPVLGIIVMILTVLNPIMALFRPHPNTKYRPIFNWAHWAVGTGAYVIGIVAIFFGLLLDKAGAPKYIIYILAAFVCWQGVFKIILELIQHVGKTSGHSDMYEMSNGSDGQPTFKAKNKMSTSSIKQLLLLLHLVVLIGFIIALLVVLNVGK